MGGQACVLYGGAEFSRDTDLAILAEPENLERLQAAMNELMAEVIAIPAFDAAYLHAGHAIHFRSHHPEADKMRIDVMSRMRGVDSFEDLWKRRTTFDLPDGIPCDVLSLPDLVLAKKTQRDKDWPMIRRLVEANYFANRDEPSDEQLNFWLRESRTASILISLAASQPDLANTEAINRPLLKHALTSDDAALESALKEEENLERAKDCKHWLPLKRDLEQMRRNR